MVNNIYMKILKKRLNQNLITVKKKILRKIETYMLNLLKDLK